MLKKISDMKYDLRDKEQRHESILDLHKSFFKDLKALGLDFHPELRGRIERHGRLEIGIRNAKEPDNLYYPEFLSSISLNLKVESEVLPQERSISVGSSGGFTPYDYAPYFRTKHATVILENWDLVFGLAESYYDKLINLYDEMDKVNGVGKYKNDK